MLKTPGHDPLHLQNLVFEDGFFEIGTQVLLSDSRGE